MGGIRSIGTGIFVAGLMAFHLTGCVTFKSAKPASAVLTDFAGHYQNRPRLDPHTVDLSVPQELEEYLPLQYEDRRYHRGSYQRLGSIRIKVETDGSVRLEGLDGKRVVARAHLQPGKDFTFANSSMRLPLDGMFANDGPGIGLGLTSVHLMLDQDHHLKIFSRSAAAGFVTVIPLAIYRRAVGDHPRLTANDWPAGYRNAH